MTAALLTFSQMVAGTVLFFSVLSALFISFGRWAETPIEAAMAKVDGQGWRSRIPFVIAAVISAMWLYASWGVA